MSTAYSRHQKYVLAAFTTPLSTPIRVDRLFASSKIRVSRLYDPSIKSDTCQTPTNTWLITPQFIRKTIKGGVFFLFSNHHKQKMEHREIGQVGHRNYRQTVVFDNVIAADGRPSMIRLVPLLRAGDNYNDQQIMNHFAVLIKREVYRLLRNYLPVWSTTMFRNNVRGHIIMTNWHNTSSAQMESALIEDITGGTLMDLFERATGAGSNPDLEIYDVNWSFFINPASLAIGGNSNFKNANNYKGIESWNKKLKSTTYGGVIKHDDIGCAALSLAVGIDRVDKINPTTHKGRFETPAFTKYCYELQQALNFTTPKIVTILDLEKFVFLKPKYRLVIIQAVFTIPYIYVGSEYVQTNNHKTDFTIYIYHDIKTNHYVSISGVTEFTKSLSKNNNNEGRWCHLCCTYWKNNVLSSSCRCINEIKTGKRCKPQKIKICTGCGANYYNEHQHRCDKKMCRYCKNFYAKDDKAGENSPFNHRCPVYIDPKEIEKVFKGDENENFEIKEKTKQFELWVWDIESHFVFTDATTEEYETEADGMFKTYNGDLIVKRVAKLEQLPNYICCMNVFTDEKLIFETMESFIKFAVITNNDGYNVFLAHNSSGYDTRLLFEAATNVMLTPPEPLFKGTKFMQLNLGNCIFRDTLLHLTQSLSSLGKAFKLSTIKGHFPHLFSRLENLTYSGIIPPIRDFDITFSCRTEQEFKEFNAWHAEWTSSGRTWDYQQQRKLYCENDVLMLQQIVKIYHEGIISSLSEYPYLTVSPWFFPTMAGHVHKLMIRHIHEGHNLLSLEPAELQDYIQTTWCALEPEEHYYAHQALRGGMTNICQYIYEGPFHYQDIQSSYPSVQLDVDNLYPVGSPIIVIYDQSVQPCGFCYANPDKCTHNPLQRLENRAKYLYNKLKVIDAPLFENIHEHLVGFFGIITVDITPPTNLYHPLIQGYDKVKKKVIGTLHPIIKETIPSCILHEAIKIGYIVTKIYRADHYKPTESKFRNGLLGDLYTAKMKSAGKVSLLEHDRIKETFMTKFKIDVGDMNLWTDNPVLKQIAKGPITSAWGKHAESLDHEKTKLVSNFTEEGKLFYQELLYNNVKLTNVRMVGENTMFNYKENRSVQRPSLHKTYLPVAVFVTAYGRLKLWRELTRIDPPNTLIPRVLMYDTDSIVYTCIDHLSKYHITEGDCLGDWETEKLEKANNGLSSFYAIGPKSYAIKCGNNHTLLKLKG